MHKPLVTARHTFMVSFALIEPASASYPRNAPPVRLDYDGNEALFLVPS
jgi:hypothetical protein